MVLLIAVLLSFNMGVVSLPASEPGFANGAVIETVLAAEVVVSALEGPVRCGGSRDSGDGETVPSSEDGFRGVLKWRILSMSTRRFGLDTPDQRQ